METTALSMEKLKKFVRNIPDFPKKGIQFKDITTLLKVPGHFYAIIDEISGYYKDKGITKIVAIESRGFLAGGAIANKLGAGIVPVRKPGKLPAGTFSAKYQLEYGTDSIEIHKDALNDKDIILLHDDLLATGGTVCAALELIKKFNVQRVYINFIIELDFLEGRKKIGNNYDIFSLLHF